VVFNTRGLSNNSKNIVTKDMLSVFFYGFFVSSGLEMLQETMYIYGRQRVVYK
jgi:hypothetical protein